METKFNIGDTVTTVYDRDKLAKIVSIDTQTANVPIYEMQYDNGSWCVNFEQDIIPAVSPEEVMNNGEIIVNKTFVEVFGYEGNYAPNVSTKVYKYKNTFYYICFVDGNVDYFKELR